MTDKRSDPDIESETDGRADGLGGAENGARFTLDDIKRDTKRRLQQKGAREPTSNVGPASESVVAGDPIRAAYAVVIVSALLVGAGATTLFFVAGGSFIQGAARWAAPLSGTLLFAVLGIGLARSATTGLR